MQPMYLYYYRTLKNPPLNDTPYINKMIEESIKEESNLKASYQKMLDKEKNEVNFKMYKNLINNSKSHIQILENVYGNINGKVFNEKIEIDDISISIKELVYRNVELSKKYRTILYSMTNTVHRYMLFDVIIDTVNNGSLLNILRND